MLTLKSIFLIKKITSYFHKQDVIIRFNFYMFNLKKSLFN